MRNRLFPFVFFALSAIPLASAQDPVAVNPAIAKVVFENDRVRVLRVHYDPHQKFALHEHPAKVAICLTQFHTRRLAPDGTPSEGTCPAGTVAWREPEKHAVENLDDAAAETIEIELKYARDPAVAVPIPPLTAPAAEPMLVNLEPRHNVLFHNQYVRVIDVQIPAGDCSQFHTHIHDTAFIHLSNSQTQSQFAGKDWGPVRTSNPGEVAFEKTDSPWTHRVKNTGSTLYRTIDVELLP